jgi:hypothetical protein
MLANPATHQLFNDQFAFRPTGSTEAALIAILHHVSQSFLDQPYVRIFALDFFKAFDTIKHSTILSNLSLLPVDDLIYNWFQNYFQGHSHQTRFSGVLSSPASINPSVFQGSAIGPPMFMVAGTDLKPLYPGNNINKYADDNNDDTNS